MAQGENKRESDPVRKGRLPRRNEAGAEWGINQKVWGRRAFQEGVPGAVCRPHGGSEYERRLNCLIDKILRRSSSSICSISFNKLQINIVSHCLDGMPQERWDMSGSHRPLEEDRQQHCPVPDLLFHLADSPCIYGLGFFSLLLFST